MRRDALELVKLGEIYADGQWQGWEDESQLDPPVHNESYSVRALEASLGISKTEVASALKRCQYVGLIRTDPFSQLPRVNTKALLGFIEYGLRYVFPAKPAEIVRGIPTGFSAPMLEGKLMSGGELIHVWPDAYGNRKGQSITLCSRLFRAPSKRPSAIRVSSVDRCHSSGQCSRGQSC